VDSNDPFFTPQPLNLGDLGVEASAVGQSVHANSMTESRDRAALVPQHFPHKCITEITHDSQAGDRNPTIKLHTLKAQTHSCPLLAREAGGGSYQPPQARLLVACPPRVGLDIEEAGEKQAMPVVELTGRASISERGRSSPKAYSRSFPQPMATELCLLAKIALVKIHRHTSYGAEGPRYAGFAANAPKSAG